MIKKCTPHIIETVLNTVILCNTDMLESVMIFCLFYLMFYAVDYGDKSLFESFLSFSYHAFHDFIENLTFYRTKRPSLPPHDRM